MIKLDVLGVMKLIPHRPPMLLIDRFEMEPGSPSARAFKAVTINEPFFAGHFPSRPIMPGVLLIEAMAQTAAAHAIAQLGEEAHGKQVFFLGIQSAKFRKPVEPGVMLTFEVTVVQARGGVRRYAGTVSVEGVLMAEAEFSAMISDTPGV